MDDSLSPIKKVNCGADSLELSASNEDSVLNALFSQDFKTPDKKNNFFHINLARPLNVVRKKLVLPRVPSHKFAESKKKLKPCRRLNELIEVHRNHGTMKLSIMSAVQAKLHTK